MQESWLADIIPFICTQLSGANPVFFVFQILIPCLWQEMASVVDGHNSNPSFSSVLTGEEVADIVQIDGLFHLGSEIYSWKRLVYW